MKLQNSARYRPGTATYSKGQETVARILQVAWQLCVDEGFAKVSIRRIARELDISPGNLSYYYRSRDDLLEDLLTQVIENYIETITEIRDQKADSPVAQLQAVIEFVLDDIGTRETTLFFPELWALANREPVAAQQMERMYARYRNILAEIIAQLCADPNPQVHQDLALAISGSIEGQTVFIGHERPHRAKAARIKALVVEQSIALVHAVPTPHDRNGKPLPATRVGRRP